MKYRNTSAAAFPLENCFFRPKQTPHGVLRFQKWRGYEKLSVWLKISEDKLM